MRSKEEYLDYLQEVMYDEEAGSAKRFRAAKALRRHRRDIVNKWYEDAVENNTEHGVQAADELIMIAEELDRNKSEGELDIGATKNTY